MSSHRSHTIEPLKQFKIGSFTVLPFDVPHDVKNVGFLVQSEHGGKLAYLTDCFYSSYKFKNVDIYAVECNYSDEILAENIKQGLIHPVHANRIKKSHFSLENVKSFFHANDLSKCREIHLIHASDTNMDKTQAVKEIQSITGCPVFCP